jgi:feruloyl esterase
VACRAIFNVHQGKPNRHPWAAKRCPNNVDPNPGDDSVNACFTDGQIATLEFIFSSYKFTTPLANGVKYFGMWAPTTDVVGRNMARFFQNMTRPPAGMALPGGMLPGAPPAGGPGGPPAGPGRGPALGSGMQGLLASIRFRGQEGAAADAPLFAHQGSLGVIGFLFKDLDANSLDYMEGGKYDARRVEISQYLDSTNPDLTPFFKHGGKLIVTVGSGDTTASSGSQLDYFQSVIDKMGQPNVDSFARFYVIPEGGHGLSGYSYFIDGNGKKIEEKEIPHQIDSFALLQDWVEDNKAPAKTEVVTGKDGSLPLCTYPAYPKYVSGDTRLATSYTCAQP